MSNKILEFQRWINGRVPRLNATSFNGTNVYINNIKPRQGESFVTMTGFSAMDALGNITTIDTTVTVPTNYNSLLLGPITIGSNGSFTIGTNSAVKIKDISDL